jgi:hypothetical protein
MGRRRKLHHGERRWKTAVENVVGRRLKIYYHLNANKNQKWFPPPPFDLI